jgi:hypothetical protein
MLHLAVSKGSTSEENLIWRGGGGDIRRISQIFKEFVIVDMLGNNV